MLAERPARVGEEDRPNQAQIRERVGHRRERVARSVRRVAEDIRAGELVSPCCSRSTRYLRACR